MKEGEWRVRVIVFKADENGNCPHGKKATEWCVECYKRSIYHDDPSALPTEKMK